LCNYLNDSYIEPLPSTSPETFHIVDTGATAHFGNLNTPCLHRQPTQNGITAILPDNTRRQPTHIGQLPIGNLPPLATTTHLLPLFRDSLLSIPVLCDHGCTATFDEEHVTITKNNKLILQGPRDPRTRLWKIALGPKPTSSLAPTPGTDTVPLPASANSAYHQPSQKKLVRFLHAAAGSPVPSTWIAAIQKEHYATWPGLTDDLIRKHLPKSVATVKGHLDQQRQNIRSTKPNPPKPANNTSIPSLAPNASPPKSDDTDCHPTSDVPNQRTYTIYAASIDIRGEIATDLTGRFPTTSYQGHKYILIVYDYDSNAILVEPMKNRSAQEHLRAYNILYHYLCARGFRPILQKLDNECSE
jgi:hypothetical protein